MMYFCVNVIRGLKHLIFAQRMKYSYSTVKMMTLPACSYPGVYRGGSCWSKRLATHVLAPLTLLLGLLQGAAEVDKKACPAGTHCQFSHQAVSLEDHQCEEKKLGEGSQLCGKSAFKPKWLGRKGPVYCYFVILFYLLYVIFTLFMVVGCTMFYSGPHDLVNEGLRKGQTDTKIQKHLGLGVSACCWWGKLGTSHLGTFIM